MDTFKRNRRRSGAMELSDPFYTCNMVKMEELSIEAAVIKSFQRKYKTLLEVSNSSHNPIIIESGEVGQLSPKIGQRVPRRSNNPAQQPGNCSLDRQVE